MEVFASVLPPARRARDVDLTYSDDVAGVLYMGMTLVTWATLYLTWKEAGHEHVHDMTS